MEKVALTILILMGFFSVSYFHFKDWGALEIGILGEDLGPKIHT